MSTFEFATLKVGTHRAGPSSWSPGTPCRDGFMLALVTLGAATPVLVTDARHEIDLTGIEGAASLDVPPMVGSGGGGSRR